MTAGLPAGRRRPTRADQEAFKQLSSTALEKALASVKVWRSGYVMLVAGVSAILALVGTQLDSDVAWPWRLALSVTLGTGLFLVAWALKVTLAIEGGKAAVTINLQAIVQEYNSFEMYQAERAATALEELDRSKRWAGWGAACCLAGLVCTLWMTSAPSVGETPLLPAPTSGATVSVSPRG